MSRCVPQLDNFINTAQLSHDGFLTNISKEMQRNFHYIFFISNEAKYALGEKHLPLRLCCKVTDFEKSMTVLPHERNSG